MASAIPLGVAVLAVSASLLGLMLLLAGVLLPVPFSLASSGSTVSFGSLLSLPTQGAPAQLIADLLMVMGLILLLIGIGLWRHSNFARVLLLLFQVPVALVSMILLRVNYLAGIIGLVIGLIIILYLNLPSVISYFGG